MISNHINESEIPQTTDTSVHFKPSSNNQNLQKATLGAGCFWCIEAIFQRLKGVIHVESGYAGGITSDTTYKQVCSGKSGHTEVVQITYNPQCISYEKILDVFFSIHDPTAQKSRGKTVRAQYKSVIFYHTETQKTIAEDVLKQFEGSKDSTYPILTQVLPLKNYCTAEESHQKFYDTNTSVSYCQLFVKPKLDDLYKNFGDMTK